MIPCCFNSVPSGDIEWLVPIILIKYSPSEMGPLMDKCSAYERILLLLNLCLQQRYPCFLKIHYTPLHFYERPTLVPVFTNRKKFEEDFCFYEKRWKAKIALGICFAVNCFTVSTHPEQENWHHQAPSPAIVLGLKPHRFEMCLWASVIYLNIFCVSVNKMCP